MKQTTIYRTIIVAIIMATLMASPVRATTITQDFEGSSLGSTTPPSGWSLVEVETSKTQTYEVSSGYAGAGLGGQLSGQTAANQEYYPAIYLVNSGSLAFDATHSVTGSFDIYLDVASDDRARPAYIVLGDAKTNITTVNAGEWIGANLRTDSFGAKSSVVDGAGNEIESSGAGSFKGGNWYDIDFSWTPTNGLSGDFYVEVSGTHNWSITHSGYTFDTNIIYFGFGAGSYWGNRSDPIFDNISITGTIIPESPAVPPEVNSITNNVSDGPVETDNPITYTVTFNEAMDDTTITTNSFTNAAASAATVTIDSVSGSDDTYDVVVTPTSSGDIVLQVSSNVTDLSGNLMTNNVDDATTIEVQDNAPTIAVGGITSDKDAGAEIDLPVTYTVTFSETMDAATFAVGDFTNAAGSGATITVDSVNPATDTNVFTVVVTPSTAGNLQLRVKSGSVEDLSGNATTQNYDDATTITVTADTTPPEVSSFTDDTSPNAVAVGGTVTYTITFNEPISAATVKTTDFANASNATINVTSVSPATDTNVFTVAVSPTSTGGLKLRLLADKVVDLSGNTNDVAFTDDTVITVVSSSDQDGTWTNNANGNWSEIGNWDNSLIADGTNYTATLGDVITADRTITLDSNRTIGNITALDTSHNYTISGGNTLTLDRTDATPPTISMPNNRALRIDSPIAGSDGLAKSGAGTLRITDTSSNLSGDIEIASGTLQSTWQALGSGSIFFTGDATLSKDRDSDKNFPESMGITINPGVRATIKSASFYYDAYFAGVLAGDTTSKLTVSLGSNTELRFVNTANTFEGEVTISGPGINLSGKAADFYSLADSAQKISVANGLFRLRNGGVSMNFANRPFEMNNNIAGLDNDSSDSNVTLSFTQDLIATIGDTDRTLTLAGANTGDNTFAGVIGDSANGTGTVSVTKEEAGKWILSGENTYSGVTTVNAGTLVIQGQYTLGDSNTVNIVGGKLEIGSMERIGFLQTNGVASVPATGSWGSTSSSADNQNDTYFTGTGVLYVGVDLPATGSVFRFK